MMVVKNASMGPCPFRHGYLLHNLTHRQSGIASMGPCPFRHGYEMLHKAKRANIKLQWGHALSGMDMRCCTRQNAPTLSFNGAMPFQAWI